MQAGREHDVPCDVGECKYSPSPGDTGPNGCGLLPENELSVWLYPRWKAFGDAALTFIDLTLTPQEGEVLLDKLFLINEYIPAIQAAEEKRGNRKALSGNSSRSRRRK